MRRPSSAELQDGSSHDQSQEQSRPHSARGIAKAVAERFGSLGTNVVVNYVESARPAQETVAAIGCSGGHAIAVPADISNVADIERLFAETIERFSCIDIVVANTVT